MSSSKKKKIRIRVEDDKSTVDARIKCASVVATLTPKSALCKAHPELQSASDVLIALGAALASTDTAVHALEDELAAGRGTRNTQVEQFDAAYGVFVAHAEKRCTTPEEASSLGLTMLTISMYALAQPTDVQAKFNAATSMIDILVKHAPGMRACIVEISTDPFGPTTWRRLPGFGAEKSLSGYAPGTYWVRAASARANEESAFTSPVAVIVK